MAVKKKAAKKKVAKKKVARKPAAAAPAKKIKAIKEPMTKSAMLNAIAEDTELTRKQVAAVLERARKGINPFTGEETMFKAKPALNVVKILPLKGLKDMV